MAMTAGRKRPETGIGRIPAAEDDAPPSGGIAAAVQRAQDAVAELSADYRNWALADLSKAEAALAEARSDPARAREPLQRLYGIAHDMKGQGGSFGFPLVTHVSQSLCRLLHGGERQDPEMPAEEASFALVEVHLKALRLILEKSVRGEGGDIGQRLVAKLRIMAAGESR